jgi:plastocyanin
MRRVWWRLGLVVLPAVLFGMVLMACGGDDSDGGDNGSTPPTEAAEGGEESGGGNEAGGAGTTVEVTAEDNSFSVDEISVSSGEEVTVAFSNEGSLPHNIAFYTEKGGDTIVKGDTIMGGQEDSVSFTAPSEAGEYYFQCDVHPNEMTGTLVVQ